MFDDIFLTVPLAYACGCLSFALLAARLRGVDIRAHGSGNPGATNVGRVMGAGWGRAVLVLDILKGFAPAWLLTAPMDVPGWVSDAEGRALLVSAAVVGHVYPIWAGFRGGKGVATLVGGLLAFDWVLALVAVAVHVVVKKGLRFVSLASVALAWSFPAAQLVAAGLDLEGRRTDGVLVMVGLAVLVTVRHADNFRRLKAGTEDSIDEPYSDTPGAA